MLGFFVNHAGRWSIDGYLEGRAQALAGRVEVTCYEDLPVRQSPLAVGACIFSAIDQLTPAGRDAVSAVWKALRHTAPDRPLLNDPLRVRRRYDLLRTLADEGVNRFEVTRASEAHRHRRFPAFVREEHRHNGARTGLLSSPLHLARALSTLVVRGYRLADLLVVEFCDVRDRDGLVRKYSAFRVADRIMPRSINVGRHWEVKSHGAVHNEDLIDAERAFLEDNPHERWLTDVFDLASIEYGRIDYGLLNGVPQVWEINTGPTISRGVTSGPRTPGSREQQEPNRRLFHGWMVEALASLADVPVAPLSLPLDVRTPAGAPLTRPDARGSRFRAFDALHQLADRSPVLGWLRARGRPLVERVLPRFRGNEREPNSAGT